MGENVYLKRELLQVEQHSVSDGFVLKSISIWQKMTVSNQNSQEDEICCLFDGV